MTPDESEDDRTLIRPPGTTAMPPAAFQPTEWSGGAGAAAMDRTQVSGPPPPHQDFGSGLPSGTRLGEFEITELVGEGGFGLVYAAHDHSLQRRVALKEYMPSSLAARAGGSQVQVKSQRHRETFEAGLKSFINEARLLASFDHPSLVKVYRFWEANGTAYMVMPFLDGATLKDVLRQMGTPPDEAWLRNVLGPLTEALLVIHAEQCYHRDIAPDNVMLMPGGNRWLLLDFGAARRVIGDMTQALTVILKPGYAPVEQYAEIPGMKQGPWTDVYALAAVVYFAIMGRTPPPSVGRLLNDTYVPLVQSAAGRYSERFLAAIDRALAVRPEERTQSIGEFRGDLGLGDAGFVPDTTMPMPLGTQMPARSPQATVAAGGLSATALFPPAAAPAPRTTSTGPATVPAPPVVEQAAGGKGKGLMIGAGVVVLAVLGVGGYALLAPTPATAPPVEPVAGTAPAPATPAITVPAIAPDPTPAPVPAPAPAPAATPVQFVAEREFERVVEAQSGGFNVRAELAMAQLSIARKDEVKFKVTADRDGLLYVLGTDPEGTLALVVPNKRSPTVRVRKGQTYSFPANDRFFLAVVEPTGTSTMLVIVSEHPRRFDAMQPKAEGDVQMLASGEAATAILASFPGPNSPLAGAPQCPAGSACTDAYGAAVMRFDTVK